MNRPNKAPPHPDWQPIGTAPANTDLIVYWPLREYNENDMPRGKVVGGIMIVSRKSGSRWDEPECMSAVGHYFDDDHEYAESPTHWMPAPPPPVLSDEECAPLEAG